MTGDPDYEYYLFVAAVEKGFPFDDSLRKLHRPRIQCQGHLQHDDPQRQAQDRDQQELAEGAAEPDATTPARSPFPNGKEMQPLSELCSRQRVRRRQAIVDLLAHADPTPSGRAAVVMDVVRRIGEPDVAALRDHVNKSEVSKVDPKSLLGPLGMSLLEEIKISGCDKLRMALCRCVLKLGATTKRSVTRLGVNISEAEWRMCKRKVAGLPDIPKKKRGRPNKIDNPVLIVAVRNALASMSPDSCRLRMSKADRRDAKGRKLVLQIKTLKGSKRTIFAKKLSTMLMSFKRSSM